MSTTYINSPDEKRLTDLAIKHALSQNWKAAIKTNQDLVDLNHNNVEALNRLAYAHLKSGNLSSSKITYKKVLKMDKYNPIALKNIKWMEHLSKSDIHPDPTISPTPTIFLEEPGKTKIVQLVHAAPLRILCNIITAQKVFLLAKKHSVEVRDGKNIYIGALPDDLAFRLLRFMAAGNTYDAYIKNVSKNLVAVFVRELKRGKKFSAIPSFTVYNSINSPNKQVDESPGEASKVNETESEPEND